MMNREISTANLRESLEEVLGEVESSRDSIVIKEDGRVVAVLIDAKYFERIRCMQQRFDGLSTRMAEAYAAVPEEDGMAEIKRASTEVRAELKAVRASLKGSNQRNTD